MGTALDEPPPKPPPLMTSGLPSETPDDSVPERLAVPSRPVPSYNGGTEGVNSETEPVPQARVHVDATPAGRGQHVGDATVRFCASSA